MIKNRVDTPSAPNNTTNRRIYLKPELIIVYGGEGEGNIAANGLSRTQKTFQAQEGRTPILPQHYGPS